MANDRPFDDDRVVGGEGTRPQAAAALWTVQRDAHVGACWLLVSPLSTALQIVVDGSVVVEHCFASLAEATVWASDYRADLLSQGWHPADDEPPPGTRPPSPES